MSERDHVVEQVDKYVLTEQDFRQLILEKLERAKMQAQIQENRRLSEFA